MKRWGGKTGGLGFTDLHALAPIPAEARGGSALPSSHPDREASKSISK